MQKKVGNRADIRKGTYIEIGRWIKKGNKPAKFEPISYFGNPSKETIEKVRQVIYNETHN